MLAIYEVDPGGERLSVRIQEDWAIFTLSSEQVDAFLASMFPEGDQLLGDDVRVRLRSRADGVIADHAKSWAAFSDEIRSNNRYFPRAVPDGELLSRVLLNSVLHIDPDIDLYRARPCGTNLLTSDDMSAPPPELATGGRANPIGIPYLYLGYSEQTCIYETRVSNHSRVAVARFRPTRRVAVLNLADIAVPDFFSIPEVESVDDQISQVELYRYLCALSGELSKPVRSSDQPTDYIPTQYLCEMAKSLDLDGVLYSSSLDPGGRNVVLFDTGTAQCMGDPTTYQITSLTAEWTATT
ncbi:RES family NAD+ phosphorylase [Aeromicrobium fastidiosum]|uniref:RES family NAD+ phosphorylase n=1 Tax=Aeromicrobium fastidiosum TaxID=52699 RepID=A0A641AS09_9ACTN|nr:RES family NAD+ phosphorylase [Aeromicrobium fastidiosum]KAA1380462.1 RES family NAD+ phosphorylase [Aeromicrobium fastidiosum]MBP2390044.1 RES domain-containing protein [Aeromicrobium fastidiosum]